MIRLSLNREATAICLYQICWARSTRLLLYLFVSNVFLIQLTVSEQDGGIPPCIFPGPITTASFFLRFQFLSCSPLNFYFARRNKQLRLHCKTNLRYFDFGYDVQVPIRHPLGLAIGSSVGRWPAYEQTDAHTHECCIQRPTAVNHECTKEIQAFKTC